MRCCSCAYNLRCVRSDATTAEQSVICWRCCWCCCCCCHSDSFDVLQRGIRKLKRFLFTHSAQMVLQNYINYTHWLIQWDIGLPQWPPFRSNSLLFGNLTIAIMISRIKYHNILKIIKIRKKSDHQYTWNVKHEFSPIKSMSNCI